MEIQKEMISLHRYWIRADAIKACVGYDLAKNETEIFKDDWVKFAKIQSSFMRLECFYSLIYVLIEGYQKTKNLPRSKTIDKMLDEKEIVAALRRFRNSVFHFQKDILPNKWWDFIETKESEKWIKALHKAFEKYFMTHLPIEEKLEELKK